MPTLTDPLTLGLTGEVATAEVHGLYAHGKLQLGDIPCEKKDRATRQENSKE